MPTTAHFDQPTLFDLHPEGIEPPIERREITPGCLLPAPPSHFVDLERACRIFGVTHPVVANMLRSGLISGGRLGPKMRLQIDYASIVACCDALRVKYHIHDRRPKIAPGRRWRDADLLPFPLTDTVSAQDVMVGLDLTKTGALNLVEEGAFEAYRIFDGSPWRISKTSLFAFRDRKRAEYGTGRTFRGKTAR
jgi:hypothetical protein